MITAREKRWLWIFSAVVIFITTIPYILAYSRQGSDWVFTGFLFGVEDGNSYIAKMLNGWHGAWTFKTPYTNFQQAGVLLYFPYILLGKLVSQPATHEQLVALFQLFRFGGIVLYIFGCYSFISHFIEDEKLRRWGIILAVFGGGLGWVLLLTGNSQLLGSLPLEYYSPEAFGFLEVYGLPHLAMARGALLFGLTAYLGPKGLKMGAIVGGWLAFASLMQPLTGMVGCLVIAVHQAITGIWIFSQRSRRDKLLGGRIWLSYFQKAIIAALIVAPFLLYDAFIVITDPFMKAWNNQDKIISPHPFHYFIAYLIVMPIAVFGIKYLLRENPWKSILIASWLAVFPFLAYLPVNIQRRLPEGIWIVWIIFAIAGLSQIRHNARIRWVFALTLPSTLIFIVGSFLQSTNPAQPIFVLRSDVEAFKLIPSSDTEKPIVLAAYSTSNALPAWSPVQVVIGHGPESIGLAEVQPQVDSFYQSKTSDQLRLNFIAEQHIDLIYWGPAERALGEWQPESSFYLTPAYQTKDVTIFRVDNMLGNIK